MRLSNPDLMGAGPCHTGPPSILIQTGYSVVTKQRSWGPKSFGTPAQESEVEE